MGGVAGGSLAFNRATGTRRRPAATAVPTARPVLQGLPFRALADKLGEMMMPGLKVRVRPCALCVWGGARAQSHARAGVALVPGPRSRHRARRLRCEHACTKPLPPSPPTGHAGAAAGGGAAEP